MKLGIKAHIYVPRISSQAKINRIMQYGAEIVVGGDTYIDAYNASHAFATANGLLEVHAYDMFETLCGQGTVALEWLEQTPGLDTLLVAVGVMVRLRWPYYAGLRVAGSLMLYHYFLIRDRSREGCFKAFRHNNWVGAAVFAGIVASYLVK